MKLHIISDLHLEFQDYRPGPVECDAVVVAGDVSPGSGGLKWLHETYPHHHVIYVTGNHEYYGYSLARLNDHIRKQADGGHVHFLQNESFVLGDALFVGGTLWTDFKLCGSAPLSELACQRGMADFRLIRMPPDDHAFTTREALEEHERTRSFIREQLLAHPGRKRVVVTHHAPSEKSIARKFEGHPLNPAYASNLEELILETEPDLWIHGHIHARSDYQIGKSRVVANPRGLPEEQPSGFDPEYVLEI